MYFSAITTYAKTSNFFTYGVQMFGLVCVFAFVCFLAFYSTKWVSSAKFLKKTGSNIKVIENVRLSQQSSLVLARIGNEYVLLGVTKENINLLKEVSKDEISVLTEENQLEFPTFSSLLQKFREKKD